MKGRGPWKGAPRGRRRAGVRGRKLLAEETDWRQRIPGGSGTWERIPKRIELSSLLVPTLTPTPVSGLEEERAKWTAYGVIGTCGIVGWGESPGGREVIGVRGKKRLSATGCTRVRGSWGWGCREGSRFAISGDPSFEQGEAVGKADAELRGSEAGRFKDRKIR